MSGVPGVAVPAAPAESPLSGSLRAAFYMGMREVKISLRTPAYWIPNLLMPIVFFFFMTGSLSRFAERFGLENWAAFALPMSVIFAVTGGSAGLNMVTDIETGYFDKLLLTPASRLSVLAGAMAADLGRIASQGLLMVAIGLVSGMTFATGLVGAAVMVGIASLWGFAYSAIGFGLALKTGNPQVVGSMWAFQIPMVFLTTAFAPKEALSGWLRTAATFNPMTYLLDGLRALSMRGWDVADILLALGMAVAFGLVTLTLAFRALLGRVR